MTPPWIFFMIDLRKWSYPAEAMRSDCPKVVFLVGLMDPDLRKRKYTLL